MRSSRLVTVTIGTTSRSRGHIAASASVAIVETVITGNTTCQRRVCSDPGWASHQSS